MEALRSYLNSIPVPEQEAFAVRCGTTLAYLRKAISVGHCIGVSLAISLEKESGGAVPVETSLPGVDWAYLRGVAKPPSRVTRRKCG